MIFKSSLLGIGLNLKLQTKNMINHISVEVNCALLRDPTLSHT